MVQRKPVIKPGIQAQTNGFIKLEMKPPFQYPENRNRGGCDLMKKMKKGTSFKPSTGASNNKTTPRKPSPAKLSDGSSPNYMKPTSSSDARKESFQVSPKSRTTAASPGSKLKRLGSLKSKTDAGLKSNSKSLNRSSSLRPVRPSMKKSSGVALHPKVNIVRPTCSSTLKDSKFPAYLDLDPGGTEVEGTSVMKVCPYTYCSLNGHYHEPLPPLKCFLSAKRKSLKTQNRLKLDAIPSPKMEIDTGQIDDSGAPAMLVDEGMDFFVEIYAKPREEMKEPNSCDIENKRLKQEESKFGVDDNIVLDLDQSAAASDSQMVLEGNINETESSDAMIDVMFALNINECDQEEENEELIVENFLDLIGSDMEGLDSNYSMDSDQDDWEERLSQFKGTEKTYSIILDDEESFEFEMPDVHEELVPSPGDAETQQLCDEDAESSNMEFDGDWETFMDIVWIDENEVHELEQSTEEEFDDQKEGKKMEDHEVNNEVLHLPQYYLCGHTPEPDMSPDEAGESLIFEQDGYRLYDQDVIPEDHSSIQQIDEEQNPAADEVEEKNNDFVEDIRTLVEINISKSEDSFENHLDTAYEDQTLEPEQMEAEAENSEEIGANQSNSPDLEDINSEVSDRDTPGTNQKALEFESDLVINSEIQDGAAEEDQTEPVEAMTPNHTISENSFSSEELRSNFDENNGVEDATTETEVSNANTSTMRDSSKPVTETSPHDKESYKRKSKEAVEQDSDTLREFNPRAPRFLDLEPDPDAEKVDLRHQMMDERKNAEEWMLDYALRSTVNKLGHARKRRVALLVEAFETVIPPIRQRAPRLHGATASFTQARPIQACS